MSAGLFIFNYAYHSNCTHNSKKNWTKMTLHKCSANLYVILAFFSRYVHLLFLLLFVISRNYATGFLITTFVEII